MWAALGTMLEAFGVDAGDRELAIEAALPGSLARDDDGWWIAGPCIQDTERINLALARWDLEFIRDEPNDLPRSAALVRFGAPAMTSIATPRENHAIVFTGVEGGLFTFSYTKWAHSEEPESIAISADEVDSRLVPAVAPGRIAKAPDRRGRLWSAPRKAALLEAARADIDRYESEFLAALDAPIDARGLADRRDGFFRALLLDERSMQAIVGDDAAADRVARVLDGFMRALRAEGEFTLGAYIEKDDARIAFDDWRLLNRKAIESLDSLTAASAV
jgi:hypothetical protein